MLVHNHGDDIEPRLDQLLHRWEELQQQGESRSPEELCSTCPELAGELAGYQKSSGSLRFPVDQPLTPELVEKLIAVRLRQAFPQGS